jgi:hypothetical protein
MHAMRRTCLALLGVLGVFGSGAYSVHALYARGGGARVSAPSIVAKPARRTWRTSAGFRYRDRWRAARFQCSLDGSRWKSCKSPTRYPGPLAGGWHTFRVRALAKAPGAARRHAFSRPTSYTWLVDPRPPVPHIAHPADLASPNPPPSIDQPPSPNPPPSGLSFSIAAGEIVGVPLYPGAAPRTIALTLSNPNDVAIFVTGLSVTVPSGPPGCDPAANLGVVQSDVSSLAPLDVPAHSSVTLPAQGRSAPTIQLVDLPINQDACQNARFPLSFAGSAHS